MSIKVHFNVGTIGHVDHGKTTLTAAITAVQAARVGGEAKSYDEIAKASEAHGRRDATKIVTIATSHVEYESRSRHYAHIDCPGHADFIKNMIVGAAQMDGAILLVDASQGPQQQTREHILLAKQVGIQHMAVFLNKCDIAEADLIDIVELETQEMLTSQRYDTARIRMIRGSALGAMKGEPVWVRKVHELVDALDEMPLPPRDQDGAFLMPVENVHTIPGRGTVATGRVSRGRVRIGDEVEIVGLVDADAKPRRVVVTGTQAFHKDIPEACAGDNIGLLLRGVKRDEIQRGQILAAPSSIEPHARGKAELYVLAEKEGGRATPFGKGYQPQFFFGTTDVTGTIAEVVGAELIAPGDRASISFDLHRPVGVEVGMQFAIREGGKTIGAGRVTEVS